MVVPLSHHQDAPAPAVVKEFHSYLWWIMLWILLLIAALQVEAGDAFGMFFTAAMAGVIYYLVSENCANMSMYCLLVFGLIAGFQSLFGLLTLFSVLGGRSSTTTAVRSKDDSTVTYETRIQIHPFFDSKQGTKYNMQSLVLLVLPIAMLLCTVLAYWSFKAYPHGLFSEFDEEAEPMYSAPPPGNYGGGQGNLGGPGLLRPQGPVPESAPRLFEGQGRRLGGD
eukprot:TRINITY_DN28860_c0_g1_i1.p1 TRINITY_DN28860_c0_g1~~TRINITY_DN28860_c0_g1_i1.p1  ORF type:complete len:224 (-),score=24.91 TRINITY_DN28860_c0_g1_i1:63-734(-)